LQVADCGLSQITYGREIRNPQPAIRNWGVRHTAGEALRKIRAGEGNR
jgi:hypothetical protein